MRTAAGLCARRTPRGLHCACWGGQRYTRALPATVVVLFAWWRAYVTACVRLGRDARLPTSHRQARALLSLLLSRSGAGRPASLTAVLSHPFLSGRDAQLSAIESRQQEVVRKVSELSERVDSAVLKLAESGALLGDLRESLVREFRDLAAACKEALAETREARGPALRIADCGMRRAGPIAALSQRLPPLPLAGPRRPAAVPRKGQAQAHALHSRGEEGEPGPDACTAPACCRTRPLSL